MGGGASHTPAFETYDESVAWASSALEALSNAGGRKSVALSDGVFLGMTDSGRRVYRFTVQDDAFLMDDTRASVRDDRTLPLDVVWYGTPLTKVRSVRGISVVHDPAVRFDGRRTAAMLLAIFDKKVAYSRQMDGDPDDDDRDGPIQLTLF